MDNAIRSERIYRACQRTSDPLVPKKRLGCRTECFQSYAVLDAEYGLLIAPTYGYE